MIYRPGKENVVADALSRQYCNALDDETSESSTSTVHSRESSQTLPFPVTNEPLNAFKRRIELEKGNQNATEHSTIFPNYIHHTIRYKHVRYLIDQLKLIIEPNLVTAIYMRLEDEYDILPVIGDNFQGLRIVVTRTKVRDIRDANEQTFILTNEHNRGA